jgi:hypothetical protein
LVIILDTLYWRATDKSAVIADICDEKHSELIFFQKINQYSLLLLEVLVKKDENGCNYQY